MSEVPNNDKEATPTSTPEVESKNVGNNFAEESLKHLSFFNDMVGHAVDQKLKELNPKLNDIGSSKMSDDTISKDWVERRYADLDNKIEIEKVKSDARFERLIADSDIKFEKLMGEMNTKLAQSESTHTKWMVGVAFSLIAFTMATIGVATNLILKAIPASQSQAHQDVTHESIKQQPEYSVPPITNKAPTKKSP